MYSSESISIIIPVYNREQFLPEAIRSVQQQTTPNWELIVVDDGSEDNSYLTAEKFAGEDPRIRVLKRQRHPKGAPTCRNIGAEQSEGNYLIFLDSDDMLAPWCIEQRIETLQQYPDYDLLAFPTLIFRNRPDDLRLLWNISTSENALYRFLRNDNVWHTMAPLWNKQSFFSIGGFDEELQIWQDLELHIRALSKGVSFRYLDENSVIPDGFYRAHHDDTISQRPHIDESYFFEKFVTMRKIEEHITPHKQDKQVFYSLRGLIFQIFKEAIDHRQYKFCYKFIEWARGRCCTGRDADNFLVIINFYDSEHNTSQESFNAASEYLNTNLIGNYSGLSEKFSGELPFDTFASSTTSHFNSTPKTDHSLLIENHLKEAGWNNKTSYQEDIEEIVINRLPGNSYTAVFTTITDREAAEPDLPDNCTTVIVQSGESATHRTKADIIVKVRPGINLNQKFNIGSLFASGAWLSFWLLDATNIRDCVHAHQQMTEQLDVVCINGNIQIGNGLSTSKKVTTYYPKCPVHNINMSVSTALFRKCGGFSEQYESLLSGLHLSMKLVDYEYDRRKQVYLPEVQLAFEENPEFRKLISFSEQHYVVSGLFKDRPYVTPYMDEYRHYEGRSDQVRMLSANGKQSRKAPSGLEQEKYYKEFKREANAVYSGIEQYQKEIAEATESNYLLRRCIHRLEKGLLLKSGRNIFALDYIDDTLNAYEQVHKWAFEHNRIPDELVWANNVLKQYFREAGSHPEIDKNRKRFEQLPELPTNKENFKPYNQAELNDLNIPDYKKLYNLSLKRRSVRWFKQEKVPRDLLDRALELGFNAPTACNRQPFEFRIFDDPEKLSDIAKIPMGTRGYAENIPCLIVIIGKMNAFFSERDRHLIYIDASLAAMGVMFGLETVGLSSSAINWPDMEPQESAIRKELQLRPWERVVMMMAVGYPYEDGQIAYSSKKPLDLMRTYNS